MEKVKQRKEKIWKFIIKKQNYLIYIGLIFVIWIGAFIRTRNLKLLQGKYLLASDPYVILRYVNYIVEHGYLFAVDNLRYYPFGYKPLGLKILAYILAYSYKLIHFFIPSLTPTQFQILYPVITFILSMIAFFFLTKKLFNKQVALLATAFLTVIPGFLFRTMAGFSEKEPLGILLLFLIMYTFIAAFQSNNPKKYFPLMIISGLLTAFLGFIWGGVQFIIVIIPLFIFIKFIFNSLSKKNTYLYLIFFSIWIVAYFTSLLLTRDFAIAVQSLITAPSTAIIFGTSLILIIDLFIQNKYLKFIKETINRYFPYKLFFLLIIILITFLTSLTLYGPEFTTEKINEVTSIVFSPTGEEIFESTVAEAQKPYIKEHTSPRLGMFFYLSLISSIYLFYRLTNKLKNHKTLLIIYILFLIGFVFNRYSINSILDGTSTLSNFMYLSAISLLLISFIIIYFKSFYKDKTFSEYKLNNIILFVLIWFIITLFIAKDSIRFLHIFAPVVALTSSYILVQISKFNLTDYLSKKFKNTTKKITNPPRNDNHNLIGSVDLGESIK